MVEHITYTPSAEEPYSQDIFNMSRASDEYAKAFKAKHAVQDYIFTDGTAVDSIERRFAEDLDAADEVVVYANYLGAHVASIFLPLLGSIRLTGRYRLRKML